MPSSFTTPLILEPLDDGTFWRLVEPFDYWRGSVGDRIKIEIPIGFKTDFASVPKLLWNILPPWGTYGKAAILHDWIYKYNGKVKIVNAWNEIHTSRYSRYQCDRILLEAMIVLNVGWLKRQAIFWGVRSGGWLAWNGHKKEAKIGR